MTDNPLGMTDADNEGYAVSANRTPPGAVQAEVERLRWAIADIRTDGSMPSPSFDALIAAVRAEARALLDAKCLYISELEERVRFGRAAAIRECVAVVEQDYNGGTGEDQYALRYAITRLRGLGVGSTSIQMPSAVANDIVVLANPPEGTTP